MCHKPYSFQFLNPLQGNCFQTSRNFVNKQNTYSSCCTQNSCQQGWYFQLVHIYSPNLAGKILVCKINIFPPSYKFYSFLPLSGYMTHPIAHMHWGCRKVHTMFQLNTWGNLLHMMLRVVWVSRQIRFFESL